MLCVVAQPSPHSDTTQRLQADAKENLEIELENMRARLELLNATNPGVVEQYERRKVEIANLQAKIEQREKTQAKIQRNIDSARVRFFSCFCKFETTHNVRIPD